MRRIAIVGSGALGLYFGIRLALTGLDVRFLLRSDLAAVRARGLLELQLADRTLELKAPAVFGGSAEIGPVDLVIVTTKTTSDAELPDLVAPLLGPQSAILTFQNGLGSDAFLARTFGAGRIIGGLAHMGSNRIGPGIVRCLREGEQTLAEYGRPISDRLREIARHFEAAGTKIILTDNLAAARWLKLVWNIPFNGLAIVAGGVATDELTGNPQWAAEVKTLMTEVQRASAALGFPIADEYLRSRFDSTVRMPPYRPSSLLDYLAGRPLELEAIWGEPLRQAAAAGVPTPRLRALYEQLRALKPKKE